MKKSLESYNDIGISSELDMTRITYLMKLGLIFSLICISADIILGYGSANAEEYGLPPAFARYLSVSDGGIFWSSFIGLIGIPIECLCYFSIYRLIASQSQKYAHMYRSGIIGCLIFGDCVHVSCCALAHFMKKMSVYDPENVLNMSFEFAGYFLLPATVLFIIFYIVLIAAQVKAFAGGHTPLPKRAWIFSPLFGIIAAVILKLPDLAFTNALAAAWINLGNLWMFCGLLVMIKKYGTKGR